MKRAARWAASALLATGLASIAQAATFRVDDSASIPGVSSATLKWQQPVPGRAASRLLVGSTDVQVRLNVAPWQQRAARIYLLLPEQPGGPISVRWSTQGRLLPGQMRSGERALVYAGPIQSPTLEERLTLNFEVDGTQLSGSQRLHFHFEIDVD